MNIYLNVNGEARLFSIEQIKQMLINKQVRLTELGCIEGQKQWLPLSRIPQLEHIPLPSTPSTSVLQLNRKVGVLLGLGIVFFPFIFAWFTLRQGYSLFAKVVSFSWLVYPIFVLSFLNAGPNHTSTSKQTTETTKEISGAVFPADEVCKYPDTAVTKKFGGFSSTWGKGDEGIGVDFRYLCTPYPSKQINLLNDVSTDTKIQIAYDARGNLIEGAHTIYMEYRAVSNGNNPQLNDLDLKYRKEVLLPLVSEVVKKALKQPLSSNLIQRLQSGVKGVHRPDSCEKTGSGFVCVDNDGRDKSKFAEIYICASDESLKSNL